MRHARKVAAGVAAASILFLVGTSTAQAPTPEDSRPVPAPPTPRTAPGAPSPTPQPSDRAPGQVPAPPTGPPGPGQPSPTREEERPPAPTPETAVEPPRVPEELLPARAPTTFAPRVFVGPDLFNPPAHQGWITVTPSFTLSGRYDDNIFLTSRDREDDFIIGFTPGVTLSARRPSYRFNAGFHTSGELFLQEDELSDFGKETQFFADWYYQISPRLTFSLTDQFVFAQDSNAITSGGVSVGRQDAWRNTFTPSLRFQATPSTGLSAFASHTILRFEEGEDNISGVRDSETYRLGVTADHRLTPRLTGTAGIDVAYLDATGEPEAWTFTPRVGAAYDVTPTLRVYANGGPSVIERDGDTSLTPAIAVGLTQTFKFGLLQAGYDRAVTAETIGIADRHAFFGSLIVPALTRGLQLEFTPRYTIVEPETGGGSDDTVNTLTLTLRATYQIVRNISLIGAYTFFQQTRDGNGNGDIDQNRVFLGLQYAFPITIY